VIEGVEDGDARCALVWKLSHAVTDGVGGMILDRVIRSEERHPEPEALPPVPTPEDVTRARPHPVGRSWPARRSAAPGVAGCVRGGGNRRSGSQRPERDDGTGAGGGFEHCQAQPHPSSRSLAATGRPLPAPPHHRLRPAPVGAAQRRQGARLLCERRLPGRDRGGTRPLPRHDGSAGRGGAAGHAGQRSGLGRVGHLQQLDVGHAGAADRPAGPRFGECSRCANRC
jgi:hypothetical protein